MILNLILKTREAIIMNDNICIQKLWQDSELIQLKIVCSSAVITATTKIYVSDYLIDELICQINQLLYGQGKESFWANEKRGNHSTACVSLRFLHKDKLGHILIEVFMELDDGGDYSSHNCCFYLNTEMGLLERFCKRLPMIKQNSLGAQINLNDDV